MTLEGPRLHFEGGFPDCTTEAERAEARRKGLSIHSCFGHIVPDYPRLLRTGLRRLFTFVASLGLRSVALLPYNPSASAKYEWFDLPYYIEAEAQDPGRLAELVEMARQAGLEATVV